MSNFRPISRELTAAKAAHVVHDAGELSAVAMKLFLEPSAREAMAVAAQGWHRANQGAVVRTLTALDEELAKIG
jgi:3-deoxy-D-manno-octulosonic-acid transferase